MQRKLALGEYSSTEAFAADTRLVWSNARLYNAPMTEVPEYVCDIAKLQRGEGAVLHLDRRLPLATAILAGSYAEAVSRQGAQALQAEGRDILASFLGGTAARRVLAAAAAVDWSADPLSRGAYAVVPIGSVDARATYASPLFVRLWCSP